MAHITRRPFVSHYRGTGTGHVVHLRRGKLAHQGVGQAFWFRPLGAVLAEVPVDDRELPLMIRGRTADFQEAAVQGSVTFRFADPVKASQRLDFGLDPATGAAQGTPLDQVAGLLTELAQQHALTLLASLPLADALAEGPAAVRARVAEGLSGDSRLAETGLEIVDTRIVAVRPEAEVERALRAPARELIQQQADRAGFERRAEAVNRERAIAENELQNRIELATREEQLLTQQGANERRKAQEAAEAARIRSAGEAERTKISAEGEAQRSRISAESDAERTRITADAEAQRSRVAAESDAERARIMADVEADRVRVAAAADAERVGIAASAEAKRVGIAATAEAQRMEAVAQAEAHRARVTGEAEADRTRALGAAQVATEDARMAVYVGQDPRILLALAARAAAGKLPQIGTLNLSPDLLSSVLGGLLDRGESAGGGGDGEGKASGAGGSAGAGGGGDGGTSARPARPRGSEQ